MRWSHSQSMVPEGCADRDEKALFVPLPDVPLPDVPSPKQEEVLLVLKGLCGGSELICRELSPL